MSEAIWTKQTLGERMIEAALNNNAAFFGSITLENGKEISVTDAHTIEIDDGLVMIRHDDKLCSMMRTDLVAAVEIF